jgi:hypothetical protein
MKLIRYQPTFLLRCVTLSFVVAVTAGAFFIGKAVGSGVMCAASIGIGFILLFSADWLSSLILIALTLRIDASHAGSSLWFTDIDDAKKRQLAAFHEATKDNPTLR